jgi:hypothetical protein
MVETACTGVRNLRELGDLDLICPIPDRHVKQCEWLSG